MVRMGVVYTFFSLPITSFFFHSLWQTTRYSLKYYLIEPLNLEQPTIVLSRITSVSNCLDRLKTAECHQSLKTRTGLFITFNRDMVIGTQRNATIQKDRVSNKGDLHYIHPSSIIGLKMVTGLFITFERHGNTTQKGCVNALPTPVPIQKDRVSNKGGLDYI